MKRMDDKIKMYAGNAQNEYTHGTTMSYFCVPFAETYNIEVEFVNLLDLHTKY